MNRILFDITLTFGIISDYDYAIKNKQAFIYIILLPAQMFHIQLRVSWRSRSLNWHTTTCGRLFICLERLLWVGDFSRRKRLACFPCEHKMDCTVSPQGEMVTLFPERSLSFCSTYQTGSPHTRWGREDCSESPLKQTSAALTQRGRHGVWPEGPL